MRAGLHFANASWYMYGAKRITPNSQIRGNVGSGPMSAETGHARSDRQRVGLSQSACHIWCVMTTATRRVRASSRLQFRPQSSTDLDHAKTRASLRDDGLPPA